jgi:prepilin-type N-terminal cleavage/methylation domain-containing protein
MVPMKIQNISKGGCLANGFTLLELIIAIAIITLISAVSFDASSRSLNRSRVNAVAIELAAWFQTIRTSGVDTAYCSVIFNPDQVTLAQAPTRAAASRVFSRGNRVYSVEPAGCSGQPNFLIPDSVDGNTFTIWSNPLFQFTQRGNVVQTASNSVVRNDVRILMVGTRLLRCVRTFDSVGLFRIGSNSDAAGVGADCAANAFNRF